MRHPLLRSLLRSFLRSVAAQLPLNCRSLAKDRQGAGRRRAAKRQPRPLLSATGMAEKSPLLDAMQRDAVKPLCGGHEMAPPMAISVDNPGDSLVDNLEVQRKTKTVFRLHGTWRGCEHPLLQIAYIPSGSSVGGPPSFDGHSLWITPPLRVESQASLGPSYRGDASHQRPGESKARRGLHLPTWRALSRNKKAGHHFNAAHLARLLAPT